MYQPLVFLILLGAGGGNAEGVLTLRECLESSVRHESVRVADHAVEGARAGLSAARALLGPSSSAEGTLLRNSQELTIDLPPSDPEQPPSILLFQPERTRMGELSLRQPIIEPRAWASVSAARSGVRRAESERGEALWEMRYQTVVQFYEVLRADALVEIARQAERRAKTHAETTRRFHENGRATETDVRRADVAVSEAASRLAEAQARADLARKRLSRITGVESVGRLESPKPPAVAPDTPLEEVVRHRPDLIRSRASVDQAEKGVRLVGAEFWPSLSVAGQYIWTDEPTSGADRTTWRALSTVSWPFFESGRRVAERRARLADVRQAAMQVEALEKEVALQIEEARSRLSTLEQTLGWSEQALALARETLEATTHRFEQGRASQTELVEAETELVSAENRRIELAYSRDLAIFTLLHVLGLPY